ncbi:MAG: hypothetical protein ACTSQO_14610 [Candidatus Helarchaeota archaeon]
MPLLLVKFPEEMSKKVNMSRFLSKFSKLDVSVVVNIQLNDLKHVLEILNRNDCEIIIAEEMEDHIINTLLPIIKKIRAGLIAPEKIGEYCNKIIETYGESNLKNEIIDVLKDGIKFSENLQINTLNDLQTKIELLLKNSSFTSYSNFLTIDVDTYLMLYRVQKGINKFNDYTRFNKFSEIFLRIFRKHKIIDKNQNFNVVSDWKEKVRVLFDRVSVRGTNLNPEDRIWVNFWKVLRILQDFMSKNKILYKLDIDPNDLDEILNKMLEVQLIYIKKNEYKIRQLGLDFYNFINKQIEKRFKFKPAKIIPEEFQDFVSLLVQIALIDLKIILKRAKKPISRITFHRTTINIEKFY